MAKNYRELLKIAERTPRNTPESYHSREMLLWNAEILQKEYEIEVLRLAKQLVDQYLARGSARVLLHPKIEVSYSKWSGHLPSSSPMVNTIDVQVSPYIGNSSDYLSAVRRECKRVAEIVTQHNWKDK